MCNTVRLRNKLEIGQKIKCLTIEKCISPSKGDKNKRGVWLCKCVCGNLLEKDGVFLKHLGERDNFAGCRCNMILNNKNSTYKQMSRRRPDIVTYTAQYASHKKRCKDKNMTPVPKEEWIKIVTQPCYYCGQIDKRNNLLASNYKAKKRFTEEEKKAYEKEINGIDRVDNSKDYSADNCVPCCVQCNTMKMTASQETFLEKVSLIHSRLCNAYNTVTIEQLLCN